MRRGEDKLRSDENWLTGEAWDQQWESFRHSAWRLETRSVYKVGPEVGTLERFLETGHIPEDEPGGYHDNVRRWRAQGKTVGRVHTVAPPLSDYLRYEFACYYRNILAGEDVRILDLTRTPTVDLPACDFWLFDDEVVVIMHYAVDGTQLGRERLLEADPTPYIGYKRAAIENSVSLVEYQKI